MTESASTIPAVTEWVEVDVTRSARAARPACAAMPQFTDVSVTPLLLVARACLAAMQQEPRLNGVFDADAQEIVHRASVNLGVAVASDRGLVVPHVAAAETLTLSELARSIGDVVRRTRDGDGVTG